jgi:GDP-4-dehydro-6-deoxy-D-mannose reductase
LTTIRRPRVLVTGAGGYLGAVLMSALLGHGGFEVAALVRRRRLENDVPTIVADLTERDEVLAALRTVRPDLILHAAGRVHGTSTELFRENAAATAVLVDAVLASCPEAVVTALGSAAEYGLPTAGEKLHEDAPLRPVSVYGHAKAAAGRYLAAARERGLRSNHLRIFNPVGIQNSPDQVLGAFLSKLLRLRCAPPPRVVPMGPLGAVRDFVVLDDIATLVIRLFEQRQAGLVVNVCSGEGRCVRDLVRRILSASGMEVEIRESEAPTRKGPRDVVVGDAKRFLEMSDLAAPSPIEPILEAAWAHAVQANSEA